MSSDRRLPRRLEKTIAILLHSSGFRSVARAIWNRAALTRAEPPPPLAPSHLEQILDQAKHEPAVVSFGAKALPNLRRQIRNLEATRNVSSSILLEDVEQGYGAIIIVGKLDTRTIETMNALADMLRKLGTKVIAIIVTEDRGSKRARRVLAPFRAIFWPDRFTGDESCSARFLALFIHILGAPFVVSLRAPLGFEMIARYGRALTSCQSLYAMFDVTTGRKAAAPCTDAASLRLVAPNATILAATETEAEALKAHIAGIGDCRLMSLRDEPASLVLGGAYEDRRSAEARLSAAVLLGQTRSPQTKMARAVGDAEGHVDITVTIIFHAERELAKPALASLREMVEAARSRGIVVEARAMLDNVESSTRQIIRDHGDFLDDVCEVSFKDLGRVRNAGAAIARGRFLSFVDGDDLWGAEWLWRSYHAATQSAEASAAIWHPEALLAFWGSDRDRASDTETPHDGVLSDVLIQQSSDEDTFEPRDILLENMWSANCFAPRELHLRFPYRPDDWSRQLGFEDWRFNIETLGHGVAHRVVGDTVHLIRMKEGGSLGQLHDKRDSLPLLD